MTAASALGYTVHPVVADHALVLSVEEECGPFVRDWLPKHLVSIDMSRDVSAAITVGVAAAVPYVVPQSPPTLTLGTVRAYADGAMVRLQGAADCVGLVELAPQVASLHMPPHAGSAAAQDLYSMLTIATALLLGRLGRALVHAGGVIDPGGGAWLLVGDAHSGKSTVCAGLIEACWDYLSDDQVVLQPAGEHLLVEGWRRDFHLDVGWTRGVPAGTRRIVDPADLGSGRWRRRAPLAGILITRTEPTAPTILRPCPVSHTFAQLVRQSPWILADEGAGQAVSQLLAAAAGRPCYELRLGSDTFGRGQRLLTVLELLGY